MKWTAKEPSSEPKKRGFIPPQTPEEKLLMKRVEELCKQVLFGGQVRSTHFLSDRQQELAAAAVNKAGEVECYWDGGYPQAERKILTLLPEQDFPYQPPFCSVQIEPVSKSVKLQHRDCLGAVLGLGLDRKSIGDILLHEDGTGTVFCLEPAADLMEQQLSQIGRETVLITRQDFQSQNLQIQEREVKTATVASLRMDAVIAAMLHCGREKAVQMIRAGKVEVNHLPVTSAHTEMYEQDILTIRGTGRFRLEQIGGKSRKDRVFIQYYQY